jgi:hypothetical protein
MMLVDISKRLLYFAKKETLCILPNLQEYTKVVGEHKD